MSAFIIKKEKAVISLIVAGVLALSCLYGCASNEASEEQPVVEKVEEVEELRTIGKETDTAIKVEIENATGEDISKFEIKSSLDSEYPGVFSKESTKIKDEEKVILYFEPEDIASEAASAETPEAEEAGVADIELRNLYTIHLTFADKTEVELHDLALEELGNFSICLSEDGIAYIEFEDEKGKTSSTLETEKALIEAKAAAEAEAAAAAEAQAAAEAEEAAAAEAQNQYTYDSGASNGYSYDSGSSGYSGSQSQDQCVDDPAFL